MRVIFLDFDGVLHDIDAGQIEYHNGRMTVVGHHLFEYMAILEQLISPHPDVELVIHSSWRNHFPFMELLEWFPVSIRGRVRGTTQPGSRRYQGILAYVTEHRVSRYLILDDAIEEFERESPRPEELICCDLHLGIADQGVRERIERWLAGFGSVSGES